MTLRNLIVGCPVLLTLAIASSSWAVDLPYRTLVGSLNNFNSFGELGFVHGIALDGLPGDGNFGAAFDNVVTVNSITIDQRDDAGRNRMQNLRIYTSPNSFVTAQLADNQNPQTITLLGAGLTSDYFLVTVESHYGAPTLDNNPGLHALTFDGTLGAARTNLNAGILPTATNQFDPPNFFLDVLTNGQIVSTTGGPIDGLFFEHADATDRSITVNYGSPQSVASIGVSFEDQIIFSSNFRPVPKFVTITDSNNNSQQVTLAPHTLQYGQYALTTPIANTTSLKLTLPVGAENYFVPPVFNAGQDQSTLTGVTEFQAFADSIVPPVVAVPGDYNGNNVVDAADYVVWREHLNQTFQLANEVAGQTPGTVTQEDYAAWRARFGNTSGSGAGLNSSAVPEPATAVMLAMALAFLWGDRRRRRS